MPLFHNEVMTCLACLDTRQADPEIESGWTHIQWENFGYYICDKCWNDPSRIDTVAYGLRVEKLMREANDKKSRLH